MAGQQSNNPFEQFTNWLNSLAASQPQKAIAPNATTDREQQSKNDFGEWAENTLNKPFRSVAAIPVSNALNMPELLTPEERLKDYQQKQQDKLMKDAVYTSSMLADGFDRTQHSDEAPGDTNVVTAPAPQPTAPLSNTVANQWLANNPNNPFLKNLVSNTPMSPAELARTQKTTTPTSPGQTQSTVSAGGTYAPQTDNTRDSKSEFMDWVNSAQYKGGI
jgi:hypothetical protein